MRRPTRSAWPSASGRNTPTRIPIRTGTPGSPSGSCRLPDGSGPVAARRPRHLAATSRFVPGGLPRHRSYRTVASLGCSPSFNLARHGEDDLRRRTGFAAAFRQPAPRPAARVHPGRLRIGFVVTHAREGSFTRCNFALVNCLCRAEQRDASGGRCCFQLAVETG
jgi:hypothetical protein